MSKPPSGPDGDTPDDERGGAVLLARAALGAPAPPPQAEQASRDRALAQFKSGTLAPRTLYGDEKNRDEKAGGEGGPPAPPSWAERLALALRRMTRR